MLNAIKLTKDYSGNSWADDVLNSEFSPTSLLTLNIKPFHIVNFHHFLFLSESVLPQQN